MVSLDRFETFKAVVDAGSLTAAAQRLGQSKAVVSFNLKRLEQELGVTLLVRNTRSLALTEAGERFHQHCVAMLATAAQAIEDARSEQLQLRGTLRLTTTPEYASARLVTLLETFRAQHPQLRLHLSTSPTHADLIPERFDLAIRLGRMADSELRATLLDEHALCAVAAPSLLSALPDEAARDDPDWIRTLPRLGYPRLADLPLIAPDGSDQLFASNPADAVVTVDNASTLRAFALAGAGATVLPQWLIADDLAAGRLLPILRGHRFPRQGVYAVFPNTAHPSRRVQLLLAHLRQQLPG
ncbi:LysR family transcriptional regulator [Stenotrophomonas sp. BIGb0135]|uniref:LysR family transcriptional regulator n=1 Tax=Stenotrophomonas sp. BIGb0135 TaxID=2940620 RepID=UPI0021687E6A|nr:LysR family transcriptional regulator [Stenotrophomonas sp. BIGb0135]MCS4233273.1 DNA-binding transcriptional LysR family regulator [Stenotrophomonas sp. BIGb0135]